MTDSPSPKPTVVPVPLGVWPFTVTPVWTLIPRLRNDRATTLTTSRSHPVSSDGRASSTVTWLPRSENIEANSQPMAPPPITAIDAGRASSARTSSESSTSRPSTSKPGMVRGTDPVARTTLRPVISNAASPAANRRWSAPGRCATRRPGRSVPDAVEGDDAPAFHEAGQALEELVHHLLLAALADGEVHDGLAGLDAELLGPRHGPHHAGGLEEFLGRDAATVQARPTHLVALDHGNAQAGGRPVRGRWRTRPGHHRSPRHRIQWSQPS